MRSRLVTLTLGLALAAVATAGSDAGALTPALKIIVEEDGVYRLTAAQMRRVGFDPTGLDPHTFRLHCQGVEVAIHVSGAAHGTFGNDGYLEFYAQAMTGPFTRRNVYWLTAGQGPGRRMASRDVHPTGAPTATTFWRTVHFEEDHVYWQNPPPDSAQDHWFWRGYLQAPDAASVTFSLISPAVVDELASLRVGLQGRSDDLAVSPDHHTRISLNGSPVDDFLWDGQVAFQHQEAVPHTLLQDGPNILRVETPGDTGAELDQAYLNWIEVEYQAAYVARQDRLTFRAPGPGTHNFAVSGFSTPDILLFDITDPAAPARLINPRVEGEGEAYTLRFQDTAGGSTRYLAITSVGLRLPAALVLDRPSDLRSPANAANYLIITHPEFETAVGRLAAYRRAKGFQAQVVLVDDIYDEFNGGVFDPSAIRHFLRYARANWTVPPQYVLLAGDANLDYRDNLGTGHPNYVPTHLRDTWPLGETPDDDWFARLDDDVLPDLFIGRLPAQTSQDVRVMVDKIMAYESAPPAQPWQWTALFVADDDLGAFASISDELIGLLPRGYAARRIYFGEYQPPDDPAADLARAWGHGALIISYLGHGAIDRWGTWAGGRIFSLNNIGSLANADRLPFLVTGTCLNGFFAHPIEPYSLAEALVRAPNGGVVAAWSPTGLGYPYQHRLLLRELFAALFQTEEQHLGPAIAQAKAMAYAADPSIAEVLETFVLFGDPALKLAAAELPYRPLTFLPLVLREVSP